MTPEAIFYTVLGKSMMGSLCILVVILLRMFLNRFPKIYSYILWSVVGIRLLFSFSFKSIISLMRIKPKEILESAGVIQGSPQITISSEGLVLPDMIAMPGAPTVTKVSSFEYVSWIWLVGVILLVTVCIYRYLKLRSFLNQNKIQFSQKQNQMIDEYDGRYHVYEVHGISDAFVLGIIHPNIYIPVGLDKKEKSLILLHEGTHIRRLDYLFKLLGYGIVCIHWFNPLVWLAFTLFVKDMEMSCDEQVLRMLGECTAERKAYSETLLAMAGGGEAPYNGSLFFGESSVKTRIKNILTYKKRTVICSVVLICVLAAASVALLSNPVDKVDGDTTSGKDMYEDSTQIMNEVLDASTISDKTGTSDDLLISKDEEVNDWLEEREEDIYNNKEKELALNRELLDALFPSDIPDSVYIIDSQNPDIANTIYFCNRQSKVMNDFDNDGIEDELSYVGEQIQLRFGNGNTLIHNDKSGNTDVRPFYFSGADIDTDGENEIVIFKDLGYNGGEGGYGLTIYDKVVNEYKEMPLPESYVYDNGFPMFCVWDGEHAYLSFDYEGKNDSGLVSLSYDDLKLINTIHGYSELNDLIPVGEQRLDFGRVDAPGRFTFIMEGDTPVICTRQYVSGIGGHTDLIGYLLYIWHLNDGEWTLEASFVLV